MLIKNVKIGKLLKIKENLWKVTIGEKYGYLVYEGAENI